MKIKFLYRLIDPILVRLMRRIDYLKSINAKATFKAQIHANAHLYDECIIENLQSDPHVISIGAYSHIHGKLLVFAPSGKITIGSYCYVGHRTEIWSASGVRIGDRVLISHNVNIIDSSSHSYVPSERHEHFVQITNFGYPSTESVPGVSSAPIVIEDDVWISFGVSILKGVTIGARSIIAANSTVTKDVPPDVIYRNKIEPIITPLKLNNESGIDEKRAEGR